MVDRFWFGDLARAILLALPLAVFARPAAATISSIGTTHDIQIAAAHATPGSGRTSVLG